LNESGLTRRVNIAIRTLAMIPVFVHAATITN